MQIVERMNNTHQNRSTALVWTKSDIAISEEIKNRITNNIKTNLPNVKSYDVAVVNRKSDDEVNNILKILCDLLNHKFYKLNHKPDIEIKNLDDFFFAIR